MGKITSGLRFLQSKKGAFYFALLFAGIGVLLLLTSRAATPAIPLEVESGSITSPAKIVASSPQASGNSFVQFSPVTTPPTFSGILFGSNVPDRPPVATSDVLGAVETQIGRQFDIVRYFRSSWSNSFSQELTYANQGYVVHTSYKPWASWKQTSDDLRTPGSARRTEVENMARAMQTQMPGPFFITINHEPEDDIDAAAGKSEQDYSDMFCAFYFVFKSVGNTKAKFAPIPIIDSYVSNQSKGAKIFPGDQCIDWNGADAYNMMADQKTTNWRPISGVLKNENSDGSQRAATGWYQWATRDFTGVACTVLNNPTCYGNVRKLDGTTEPKQSKGKKPIIIGEWGSNEYFPCIDTASGCTAHAGDANKKAEWLRQAVADFKTEMPQIKAIQYWGDVDTSFDATHNCFGNDQRYYTTLPTNLTCSTDLRTVPTSYTGPTFAAFKDISDDPYFFITSGLAEGSATSAAAKKRFDFVNAQ